MQVLNPTARRAAIQTVAGRNLLRAGTLGPALAMNSLAKAYYRVLWLGAAAREGVLRELARRPRGAAGLAASLGLSADAADALGAWLDLGVAVGVLRVRAGRYALRGIAVPLASVANDAVAAFYIELATLHHALVTQAVGRLREGRPFAIADADPELIARSSRLTTPYLAAAIERVVPREGAVRLVEVGCGSGEHIRTAATCNGQLTAVGIELQEPAAALARANLAAWGLGDRVAIEVGDVRDRTGTEDADIVSLHQNIYYFAAHERVALLRHLATFLAPGGRLLVTTACRGTGHAAAGLDLWAALTEGADRLPRRDELLAQVRAAGYADAEALDLTPDGMFCAFVGVRRG